MMVIMFTLTVCYIANTACYNEQSLPAEHMAANMINLCFKRKGICTSFWDTQSNICI